MPVLPEVGSISTVLPGVMRPSASSASIIGTPMRSLTDDSGLKNSSLSRMSALVLAAAMTFESRTSGVWPMVSAMES